jgi:hypothetical protein
MVSRFPRPRGRWSGSALKTTVSPSADVWGSLTEAIPGTSAMVSETFCHAWRLRALVDDDHEGALKPMPKPS